MNKDENNTANNNKNDNTSQNKHTNRNTNKNANKNTTNAKEMLQRKKMHCIFAGLLLCVLMVIAVISGVSLFYPAHEDGVEPEIKDAFDVAGNGTEAANHNDSSKEESNASTEIETTLPAEAAPPAFSTENLPRSAYLDVAYISQYPELPTGCEITSLTEVLQYLGYSVDKEDLVKKYLFYDYTIREGCFMEYFVGSPYDPNACGCFAPALTKVANDYLRDQKSGYHAYDISYSDPAQLFAYVASGTPVIAWTCLDYSYRDIEYQHIYVDDETTFDWPMNEHCVALIGYDLDKGTVTFADPSYGIISRSISDFTYYYGKYYSQAMIIQ